MVYWRHLSAMSIVLVLFFLSLAFANWTMFQTILGLSMFSLFLALTLWEIRLNSKQVKRPRLQVILTYICIYVSLFLFNMSVHQTSLSTFGQTNVIQFWNEHDTIVHLEGKTYHLIWSKSTFPRTVYFYNLYGRKGLFFQRLNDEVIYYSPSISRGVDRGAVGTFLRGIKGEKDQIGD